MGWGGDPGFGSEHQRPYHEPAYPVPYTGVSGVVSSAGIFRVTPLRGEPPNAGTLFTFGSGLQMPID